MTRRDTRLSLIYQEFLTGVVKLRAGRETVADAEAFRANIRAALAEGDAESRRQGYSDTEIQLARFGIVAFLDETVLNSGLDVFSSWARKPLQEELFGVHVAGEIFFQNLDRLLRQPDSEHLAELLEVYYLCLLLGFGGRYSRSSGAELRVYRDQLAARIARIRGEVVKPAEVPPARAMAPLADPWVARLTWAAGACLILVLLLFITFKWSLAGGLSDLRQLAMTTEVKP